MARIAWRVLFILSLSVNIALAVYFFSPRTSAPESPAKVELNLSESQAEELSGIRKQISQKNRQLKRKIADCQQKLITALQADSVDKDQVYKCIEHIAAMQKEIQQNTADEIIQMKKILSPHQCDCLMHGLDKNIQGHPCGPDCPDRDKKGDK